MAGVQKKSTKKFEKKHLKGELERRRATKKSKQKHQQAEKKRERRAKEHGSRDAEDAAAETAAAAAAAATKAKQPSLQDMTVDDFFQGGFDLPEPKSKKRKRTGNAAQNSATIHPPAKSQQPNEEDAVSDNSSVADHQQELEALAEQDPQFYKYLQENDAELLDFDVPAGNEPASPASEVDSDGAEEKPPSAMPVSPAMIARWKTALTEKRSLAAAKEVLIAFRAAAHSDDEDAETTQKFAITSAETFHEVLVLALKHVPEVLQHHIPVKYNAAGKARLPADGKKYRTVAGPLSSHVNAIVQLLGTLSDTATLKLTLSSLESLLPYTLSLKKPLKNLLKAIVGIWSNATYDETVRINAFLLIRQAAVIGDAAVTESVLRGIYQGLVRGSRNTTAWTLPAINLMKNSAVELWGLDGDLGYTTGFSSIRQLAVHLRGSIAHPTKDSYKAIYNWQYVHSLDFWSRVLSTHCSPAANAAIKTASESALHPLIYPLVQITLGAARLLCTPAYFPLRFHLVQSLLRLSRATNTYIPLAPLLLEVMQTPLLRRPAQASTARPIDFRSALRANKALLRTRIYQDGVGGQVAELLAEFFGVWAKNIAFPELIIPPTVLLKRWLKEVSHNKSSAGSKAIGKAKGKGNANGKLNASVALLVQKLLAHAAFVERHRARVDYAVSNRAAVATFLNDVDFEDMPLGAYVLTLRRQREEQETTLEKSREEDRRREREDREEGQGDEKMEGFDEDDDEEEDDLADEDASDLEMAD